jgi:hypothetical protein
MANARCLSGLEVISRADVFAEVGRLPMEYTEFKPKSSLTEAEEKSRTGLMKLPT